MKIAMIGSGYAGLVSGVCFSDFGHEVVCVDKEPGKIEKLHRGEVPIYEPGLENLLRQNMDSGRLSFTTDLSAAMENAQAVFIAVGTPMQHENGQADLRYVMAAAKEIAQTLVSYAVVVIKSTVPVGTNRKIAAVIRAASPAAQFDVVSNPEFLREGAAIDDFMKPDRVIVGVESETAKNTMGDIYRPLYLRDFPIVYTDPESAEITKYAANAFLATKITFINEIAALCEKVGADVKEVARGMGLDGRIGNKFLHAGPGYGGSCLPTDTKALARMGQEHAAPMQITQAVIKANDDVKSRLLDKLLDLSGGSLRARSWPCLALRLNPIRMICARQQASQSCRHCLAVVRTSGLWTLRNSVMEKSCWPV
jgi:UDPglucose 6-dehydrogenase